MTQDMKVYGKFTDMFKYVIKEIYNKLTFNEILASLRWQASRARATARRQRGYVSSSTRLRLVMTLLLMMTIGSNNVLAQSFEPGLYFIASRDYVPANTTTNFYLCPTEGWYYYQSSDPYYTNSDNGMPFMTTYRCRDGVYDALNAIWSIEKVGETNYYYIKHVSDGKYLTYNRKMANGNEGRMRMHLEASPSDNDAAQFQINWVAGTSCYEITTKKENSRKYLNPTGPSSGNGNINSLIGTNARTDGPSGCPNVGGIIGLWTGGPGSDSNSKWYLEDASSFVCETPTITYNEATQEVSISTTTDGATIYYTTDGTEPTTSSTEYTDAFTVSATTNIQAIAVKTGMINSAVGSKKVVKYVYNILNSDGEVAIQYIIPNPVSVGGALSGYASIPEEIRSPYIYGEEIKYYNNADCAEEHEISERSSTDNIYITYTTNHLDEKFLHLRGARPLNVTLRDEYIYDSGSGFARKASPTTDEKSLRQYLWYFSGNDPYAVEIRNAQTNKYIGYTTPSTLSLEVAPTNKKFILMSGSAPGDGSTYEQLEFMAATGDGNYYRIGRTGDEFNISTTAGHDASLQITAAPNSSSVTYNLIDQAGKILLTKTGRLDDVVVPDEWVSPLVSTYNYWKVGAFDIIDGVYKLNEDRESYRISTPTDVEDGVIYITYEVNDLVTFDISDDDKAHNELYPTYMLRFYGGESFNQENGLDGIDASAQKAEYPYSNGDATLFVYSDTKRANQFASGASTRPRWLWYPVSPQADSVRVGLVDVPVTPGYKGDPYHVKIMSHSAQASSHNYFRTYVVNYGGSNHLVTGVTTKNENVSNSENANYQPPTEYMILSAPNDRYKLVTVNEIPLDINGDGDYDDEGEGSERRTVNTFEQYWKNNPTIQNLLGDAKVTASESADGAGIELNSTQKSILPSNWHTYQAWANAAPWVSWSEDGKTGKQYHNKHHWFQKIDMGSTGEFTFVAQSIDPEVILLDQHGWEIMRTPLSEAAALRMYDSPMVEEYQWYPTAAKVTGYHKYKVSNPKIPVYYSYLDGGKTKWRASGDSIIFTSTTLGENPYNHIKEYNPAYEEQPASVQTDFYVTYTVKPEYRHLYGGAATEDKVTRSAFMVRQGTEYAKNVGNALTTTTDVPSKLEDVGPELQWYVKPNFNIDEEMGYRYDVEEETVDGVTKILDKSEKDALNYAEGRNGFDPYNVQIQSVSNTYYYFKTSTTGSQLVGGAWTGTSTDLSLKNLSADKQENVDSYEQAKLSITNATFMVVIDSKGDTLLMPRFDQSKVVNSFSAPRLSAVADATKSFHLTMVPTVVHISSKLTALGGQYILAEDFIFEDGFTSLGTAENPFTGSIDGRYHTISTKLTTPLLAYAQDAIIKNVILDNVEISGGTNAGAIAANALGDTRIYNCGINGGSVGGSEDVGGIVGSLDGKARVINCYSYADVSGGTNVGGIVGNNKGTTTAASINTMVMNCIFYGDITSGTNKSPVYGGNIIDNRTDGLNNYNYYAYKKLPTANITNYNCALAVEDKYLNRFEFYRLLLNSNKKLAAYYASSPEETVNANDMMKWVLETADRSIETEDAKPYPILKKRFNDDGTTARYPSIINYDVENAPDSASVGRYNGGKLGKTLTVNISIGSNAPGDASLNKTSLTLQRMDKDSIRYNFNYDKVQLPYYNDVGEGNYTENKVVTGWKITSMTGGTSGTYEVGDKWNGYNFADRKCTAKDINGTSGRVFSQGAYFDVPYGVTAINIEPYWGNAAYVSDEYLDVVYNAGYSNPQDVKQLGHQYGTNGTSVVINGSSQKVYTSISDALGDSHLTGSTVYDNAVVLVGNLHNNNVPSTGSKAFTIMSVDLDKDNEPDYSYIYSHGARTAVSPIRFDFINVPGTAQAQKPNTATSLQNAAIFKTKGWFELTNTALMYFSQIEYENLDGVSKSDAPMILLGGVVDQFVSTQSKAVTGKTIYIHVGGNVWFKTFSMGVHGDGSSSTPHVPVSVTGGDYDSFYLTGTYNPNAIVSNDNAECYISSGRFGEVAGAGQEQIGTVGGGKGDIRWQIYNADISEFYGGGINDAKPAQGNIQTDIFYSYVDKFCGGPKFGNMATGKTVVTNATGCTFGKYFGAGNGGNSYSRKKYYDVDKTNEWAKLNKYYTDDKGKFYDGKTTDAVQSKYGKKGYGVATDFDYEFFVWTSGKAGVRFYVNFASFSLAQCNDVTSTLTNCTINQDFYGGGNLGSVVGTATSTLNGCTVHGNVFGGGYSAELPKIPVRDGGFTTNPNFNSESGMFEPGVFSPTTDYDWKQVANDPTNGTAGTEDSKYVLTKADLTALGQVAHTDLTVTNNCLIEGRVYGGGDMSAVNQNTLVKIENVKTSGDIQNTVSYVYGGGNTADVLGNTEVRMTSGTVSQDVYGGGRGETTVVGGNVTVNVGTTTGDQPTVSHDVYGGSAFGSVNTTADKTTVVNIYDGTVNGSVFGGGLGQEYVEARDAVGSPGDPEYVPAQAEVPAIVAKNQGNTTVTVEGGTIKTGVYGGSNKNGVLTKDATVMITGGTVGDSENTNNNVVFGGGYGAPTLVNGNVTVNIGTSGQETAGATIYGHVYGGGALGSVNTSKPASELVFDPTKKTLVNLYKGTINGYAYGGGLGSAEIPSYVGGDSVIVILDGAKVEQVFGANNINGTPKGHVKVWVKRTVDHAKPTVDGSSNPLGREDRTPAEASGYDVEAVYGGGNEADYVPTKAIGTEEEKAEAFAEVLIEGCDKTSINAVYGGGNAAAVPATKVTVKGTYIINTLYGGGNGADPAKPGADVGIYKVGETPTNYGTGKAETKLLGGYINEVYGGSNTKGDVRGGTDVQTKGKTEVVTGDYCTELNVGQIYGAGSHADVKGDVKITLECMPRDYVDAVYGGAEEATVDGNVTLTVTSGKFGRVFGGNNKGGDIRGSITVNVYEDGCKPLIIGELYGGGNAAPYSVFGCTNTAGTWTANTEGTTYYETDTQDGRDNIMVNVIACKSIGKVFGGGMGATAKVIGNTHVDINMFKGINDGVKQDTIGVIGQVFGGGGEADVIGNTLVDIGTVGGSEDIGVKIISGNAYLRTTADADTTITAGIYGGGYSADVYGNTTLNIGTASQNMGTNIACNIFGGGFGEKTTVRDSVTVNIGANAGTEETPNYVGYAIITGDVYGGSAMGKVNATKGGTEESPTYTKTAKAITQVNFYGGTINGNIYGGGEGQRAADAQSAVYYTQSECDTYNTEHSLSPGDDGYLTTSVVKTPAHDAVPAIAADVYGPVTVTMEKGSTTNTVVDNVFGCNNFNGAPKDTVAVIINGGTINESVYGGGDEAEYTAPVGHKDYPAVYINNATINENVFGGGFGMTAIVDGNPHVMIGDNAAGHNVTILKSVYGGGELAGVHGNTNIIVNKGTIGTEGQGGATYGNVYGGGFGTEDTSEMTEAEAVKEAGIVKGNTTITINGGTILHNVYGGGANGSVGTFTYDANNFITGYTSGGLATVNIFGGTIGTNGHENGMIFGSSRGDVGAPDAIQDKVAWVYDTQVTIGTSGHGTNAPEPQIKGSLYGGGENGHTYRNTSVTLYSGKVGITDVDIDGGAAYPYRGNLYGGGCGTDKYWVDANGNGNKEAEEYHYNAKAGIVNGTATVVINGGHIVRNLYGAGAMGSAVVGTNVTINGGTIGTDGAGGGYVYAAARGDEALTDADQAYVGNTSLTIAGGTIWNSAFGGGQSGIVKGSVDVTVSGGVVKNDVYGGGALANTNTDNWTGDGRIDYEVVDPATLTPTYKIIEIAEGDPVEGYYTYNSSESRYEEAHGYAVKGTTYYQYVSGSSVVGYYTKSADVYTLITSNDGVEGTIYKKIVVGEWKSSHPHTTTVVLTGGVIGNAYGGGLGSSTVAANVYGDVKVTVNKPEEITSTHGSGIAFTRKTENVTYGGKEYIVPTTGRVFGCNNINGTPTGNVEVEVYATKQIEMTGADSYTLYPISGEGSEHSPNEHNKYYEIQAVYGGGNLSDYLPATGKATSVYIGECDVTSIEKVYGGGNSAVVPSSEVVINGTFDVGTAFGGGNGGDLVQKNGVWSANDGAIVIGRALIKPKGGKVGEIFGGSDAKGYCGNPIIDKTEHNEDCPLITTRMYGAGKESDVDHVELILSGCTGSNTQIEYVFGGSYNAHIDDYIKLTITSGIFKNVFGGNDRTGGIGGDIILNIEETENCDKPLIIQNLFGGGNEAPYPGTDKNGVEIETPGKITVNVKSATRIDNVFGGSFKADVNGDTEVNINMTKGIKAGATVDIPKEFGYIPNMTKLQDNPDGKTISCKIDNAVGTIGNIFGGGNQGVVRGNSVVNINTEVEVGYVTEPEHLRENPGVPITKTDGLYFVPVTGAHITGDVYGGGNEGDVRGNTYVNICAKESATPGTYVAVAEGVERDTIGGNVFGGGKGIAESFTCEKAMVGVVNTNTGGDYGDKGTHVYIGHGSIGGSVYGGGEIGRVEFDTKVTIGFGAGSSGAAKSPVIGGEVYGAGQGVPTHGYSGLTRGNSYVTIQGDSWVKKSVYGAGKLASLGRYSIATTPADTATYHVEMGMPYALLSGGQSTVTIQGYAKVGPEAEMTMPTFLGNVFGAGQGALPYDVVGEPGRYYIDNSGNYTWESYAAPENETAYLKYIETLGITNNTVVTIGGNAFVHGSVYGGSMNGSVFAGTVVNISGGQIGRPTGESEPYSSSDWTGENSSDFTECPSWNYGQAAIAADKFAPYDKYAGTAGYDSKGGRTVGDDGHTFYGNVFGGGSGKDPYKPGKWHRRAGYVGGNTEVNISGGHILTSVYGGNELTDVGSGENLTVTEGKGKCTINMTGGTLGVPRTDEQIKAHPVTCYLFGAGKGDQRVLFNRWTNVSDTEVNITGTARIFGSVFGGGEDGHILRNAEVNIGDVTIGSTPYDGASVMIGKSGTSYLDGNVFGGGRGFSGEALTAGSTGGNVTMTISDGTMKGSVYGGGRLSSVGIGFTDPEDLYYGQLIDDKDDDEDGIIEASELKHGHITISITGGTIGNGTTEAGGGHPVSGNVFGGSMGRIVGLDGTTRIPLWPKQSVVKLTNVSVSGGTIYNSVYGGSELGIVRNRATVNVSGTADIRGSVFGGGYGSDEQDKKTISAGGYESIPTVYYTFTPMMWTGCVSGDTYVNISGGKVGKNVYGGGNYASVGLMNFNSNETGTVYNYIEQHDTINGFGLSWPYKFQYIQAAPTDDAPGGKAIGGKTTVNITGGRIGTTAGSGSGNVYGGSKGLVSFKREDNVTPITDVNEQRYAEAFCANSREAEVNINYSETPSSDDGSTTACIVGAVYGGGKDGHVHEDAKVRITGGQIGLSVYGGGEGESYFMGKLRDQSTGSWKAVTEAVHSITAGKVYGNTSVSMSGGRVVGHVYGGGNLASVGKGNYAGGPDDYYPAGYGEKISGEGVKLWSTTATAENPDNAWYFLNTGNVSVAIAGGEVGTLNGTSGTVFGTSEVTPTGLVFGGSRGRAAQDVMKGPRNEYAPDFYLGYVNNVTVTIGGGHVCTTECEAGGKTYKPGDFLSDADFTTIFGVSNANWTTGGAPRIYSQVFGGGRDGHVRGSAHVIINNGIIGQTYAETTEASGSTADYQRYHRGNVYGSGSGLGDWNTDPAVVSHGMSSGSVTRNTTVDINGGTIYNNVYGGGALSSVGPPRMDLNKDYAPATWSKCVVNINGGTIGQTAAYESHKYGGCVFGASRGNDFAAGETKENFATVLWTQVNINGGNIAGNVYGGAKGGVVWKDTEVNLQGGTIAHNAYGGGQGTLGVNAVEANVGGNTTVKLNESKDEDDSGCIVEKVFGCNDLNGTPKGHALVHVYATQHKGTDHIVDGSKHKKFDKLSNYKISGDDYKTHTFDGKTLAELAADAGLTSSEITGYEDAITDAANDSLKNVALQNYIYAVADNHYDVKAVYGGGDLAKYEPTDPTPGTPLNDTKEYAEVIIEGCELTSIGYVYGGGNAASTPSTKVRINEAYEIHEVFGGGNGKDNYQIDGNWYKNPGANVGYYATYHHDTSSGGTQGSPYPAIKNDGTGGYPNATTKEARIANYSYGEGSTNLEVTGGRIHRSYGGSNQLGNIRYQANSAYEESGACPMEIDETYGGGNKAETDADIRTQIDCVDNMAELYGGSTSGDVNSDIVLNVTNGTFGRVFGGNKEVGRILGSITVNVREEGCKPVIIGGLYAGGYKADYSIYGYSGSTHNTARTKTEWESLSDEDKAASPIRKDPRINIISATRIDSVYGGGYQARVIGEPHVNINMEEGTLLPKYMNDDYLSEQTDATTGVKWICRRGATVGTSYIGILPIGTIGNVFGGGDQANVVGNTSVEIGTGKHHNDEGVEEVLSPARNAAFIQGRVYGGGNLGDVTGNTTVEMGNGYVADRIYGGGKEGDVGTITATSKHTGTATHDGCIGKPTTFAANTGKCTVTISGGYVGPFAYSYPEAVATATITPMTMPDDYGYVFGAGRGELKNPATDKDIDFRTYVDSTVVTIKNGYVAGHEGDAEYITRPLIAGGVYGGAENGRVLRNTHVNIQGGQIGLGAARDTAYVEADFIDPTAATAAQIDAKAATMAECASWAYGTPWLPYDEHAGNGHYQTATYGAASTTGTNGHTFYGNVFGGGSGYFTYETATEGVFEWLPSAGLVEGNTYVNISGGHILTSVYGGNEMTNVTGTTNVTMTGGTLGVPRTLAQIAAHPVTCYLFGGGKGDERVHFNKSTNVGHAKVNVSGGIIYGSVFGGGEDGHVLGDVTMNISDGAKIGTWGTSYVDGNVFGGGRGFSGGAYTAGNVAGSVTLNITGGTMLGSIYGGGRLGSVGYGLFAKNEEGYGTMRGDNVTEEGFVPPGGFSNGRGHIVVNISGDNTVIGNKYEFQNVPTNVATGDLAAWQTTNHVSQSVYESTSKTVGLVTTYTHRLLHTRGGNVYTGGMGRRTQLDGTSVITAVDWHKLGNVKSTKLTITGNPWIMGNVYGGGEYGAVQGTHTTDAKEWGTEMNITGGTIGTEITTSDPEKETVELPTDYPATGNSDVQYTYGNVFGGGTGTYDDVTATTPVTQAEALSAYVANNTKVSVTNALVRGSVFGGGELGAVGGDTYVTISGTTEIGRNEVKAADDPDAGYVLYGGRRMGNVFGGGRGHETAAIAGVVKGNTNVTISGGNIYHNVYGGGALGSVGNFFVAGASPSDGGTPQGPMPTGVPYWMMGAGGATGPGGITTAGVANVTITGGTIGISGRDNGLVFGSSRGDISVPTGSPLLDQYDKVAWVRATVVKIGTEGSGTTLNTPLIKGSIYGGGENGHNYQNANVNVYSGTIGVTDTTDPWYYFTDKTLEKNVQLYRGNVYGAGSGTDTYTKNGQQCYNPRAGMVGGSTVVNIAGGHIGRSVYGAGAMASVGNVTNAADTAGVAKHSDENAGFALSWPYKLVFATMTGKATVNVTGGHIGTRDLDGGDVYGSARGEAGDRYATAHMAYVNETEVNINYPETAEMTSEEDIQNDFTVQCITGSVHGSGENGFVYGDTRVTLNKGLIGHSLYGAGKGKGTYKQRLLKIGVDPDKDPKDEDDYYDADIYSLIAGRVMGNTYVTMNDGHVGRNVYGGGNMGSVGKGNYACGSDDYYPAGYGETLNGSATDAAKTLWNSGNENSIAFLNSGKTTVQVLGGIVGYENDPTKTKNNLPYGNVFGGSAGEAAPNVPASASPRYLYCPAFFSGYVNETDVTIGTSGQVTDANAGKPGYAPKILCSVYGGGQDGHVRRDTKVTVYSGEIGMPYTTENQALLNTDDLDDPMWMHRGNIYGGGSGISEYKFHFNYTDDDYDDTVVIDGREYKETDYSTSAGSVTRFTDVNVMGGIIHRNVYGGGSMGSVGAPTLPPSRADLPDKKGDTTPGHGVGWQSQNTVNIGGGTTVVTIGTPTGYNKTYGGEVYGACRGMSILDPNQYANSVWTKVNIFDKSTIRGNVYGGGDSGIVKKDSEVKIGGDRP